VDSLATLELSQVTATAQHVRRTPSLIAATAEDYFLVSIQTKGVGAIVQDGRTAVLQPGDFALYDSTRPTSCDSTTTSSSTCSCSPARRCGRSCAPPQI
jgi:hypothetical protein